jgi:hypothetical protein
MVGMEHLCKLKNIFKDQYTHFPSVRTDKGTQGSNPTLFAKIEISIVKLSDSMTNILLLFA